MKKGLFNYVIAIILIGFGVMLVLENLDVATFNMKTAWLYLYPILFIVIGLKALIDRLRFRGGSWMWGSFLVIFGSLLLIDRFDIIHFTFWDIYKLWPLLIVYIGFSIIRGNGFVVQVGRDKRGRKKYSDHSYDTFETGEKGIFSMVGSFEYNQPNWKVRPMDLRCIAGDFYLDFSKAFIPEEYIPLRISSLAGDVQILIPENVAFRAEVHVKAGDIDVVGQSTDGIGRSLFFESVDYESADQKLDFFIKLKAGSIRIDYI